MHTNWSLRAYIAALLLAVTLPLVAFVVFVIYRGAVDSAQRATEGVSLLAQQLAATTDRFLTDQRAVLETMVQHQSARLLDPETCTDTVREFFALHRGYSNVTVRNPAGELLCAAANASALPRVTPDIDEFQRVVSEGRFLTGRPNRGGVSDQWVIQLRQPVFDADGGVRAVLIAPVELATFAALVHPPSLQPGTIMALLDGLDTFIARSEDAWKMVGTSASGAATVIKTRGSVYGSTEEIGIDGVERVWGYATVGGFGWKAWAGVPTSVVYAGARRAAVFSAIVLALALLAITWLSYFMSRWISRPVQALASAAGHVASGNLAARAEVGGAAEIAEVAREFNRMLDTRRDIEASIRRSELRYRSLATATTQMVWAASPQGRVTELPPSWPEYTGQSNEDAREHGWVKVLHPDDVEATRLAWKAAVSTSTVYEIEHRIRRRDGIYCDFLTRAVPVFDENGRVREWIGTATDITETRRARVALAEEAVRRRVLFEQARDGILVVDAERTVVEANASFARMVGYERGAVLALAMSAWDAGDTLWRNLAPDGALPEASGTCLTRMKRCDGTLFDAEVSYNPAHWAGEHMLFLVCRDVTERTRAAEALRTSNLRLHALSGRIMEVQETERAGIARELHDELGQTLSAAKLNLQVMRRDPGASALLPRIDESVEALDAALREVRSLSLKLRPPQLEELGLATALRSFAKRLSAAGGLYVEVNAPDLPPLPPQVAIACFRVVQEALTNVVRHSAAKSVAVTLTAAGNRLALEIQDSGQGFDTARARERAVHGYSMGILGMEERVTLLGGEFSLESSPGAGTIIRAELPLAGAHPEQPIEQVLH